MGREDQRVRCAAASGPAKTVVVAQKSGHTSRQINRLRGPDYSDPNENDLTPNSGGSSQTIANNTNINNNNTSDPQDKVDGSHYFRDLPRTGSVVRSSGGAARSQ